VNGSVHADFTAKAHASFMKPFWSDKSAEPQPKHHEQEDRDLDHFRSDVGMNYDSGFGSLLEDTAAGDVDQVMHEHPNVPEG
jgi:hypothetical protein